MKTTMIYRFIIILSIMCLSLIVMSAELKPCPDTPNCVSSLAVGGDRYIAPLRYTGDTATARQKLLQVLNNMSRTRIESNTETYLHVTVSSRVFGFIDDVEFLIDADSKTIQVRSAARSGRYDFGVNRRRVETIRERMVADINQ